MDSNKIFYYPWWYGETEYMLHFCCHGNKLWHDVIGCQIFNLKQQIQIEAVQKFFFHDYFLLF